jgi:hypothetical protein
MALVVATDTCLGFALGAQEMKKKSKSTCDPQDRRCFFISLRPGTCDRHLAQQAQQKRSNFKRMGYPEIYRASGGKVCKTCSKKYTEHPLSPVWLDHHGQPWVIELCNEKLVKLSNSVA